MKHAPERPLLTESTAGRLFGRESDQRALTVLLEGHSGRSALIEGETGAGKTALIEWAMNEAAKGGFVVLRGQCYETHEAGPYFPFFQILSQLRGSTESAAESSRLLANDMLGEPNSAWLGRDVREVRSRFRRSLSELIIQLTGRAQTVLVIDDLQWADAGSLLLLNHLMDMDLESPVLLLAARPDELHETETLQLVMRIRQKASGIALQGLDEEGVTQLVDHELGTGQLSRPEIKNLTAFTRGNPLFIRELLMQFRRQGSLGRQGVSDLLSKEHMPGRLRDLVEMRLSSLPAELRETLSAASVVTGPFQAELVAELAGLAPDSTRDLLDAGPRRYDFAHELYRAMTMCGPTSGAGWDGRSGLRGSGNRRSGRGRRRQEGSGL